MALLASWAPAQADGAAATLRVWTETSLTKAFPGSPPTGRRSVWLDACRNEWESFQIVLRSGQLLRRVTVSVSDLPGAGATVPAGGIQVFCEHFVRIESPSGNLVGEQREWPDALLPMAVLRHAEAPAGRNLAFWVSVFVPPRTPPGIYRGTATVSAGGRVKARLPVVLRVWDVELPAANRLGATAALYYDAIREYYNKHYRAGRPPLAEGSPEWQALKERYYRFLLEYRISPYDLPVPLDSPAAGRFLGDARAPRFRLPWLGDDAKAAESVGRLQAQGWAARGFYYQYDEPRAEQYPGVRDLSDRLRRIAPSLPYLLTLFPTPDLEGAVDIWCPDIGDTFGLGYLDHEALAAERRAGTGRSTPPAGRRTPRETWWYTMCVPRAPYPTWLVDDDASAHRIFFWMQALRGITGFVYSMVHGWTEDPYRDVSSFAGSNGDGLLLYPGEAFGGIGPFPSIRLQVIRDGIEDYELLHLLGEVRSAECGVRSAGASRARPAPTAGQLGHSDASDPSDRSEAGAAPPALRTSHSALRTAHCRRLLSSERSFCRRPAALLEARRDLLEEVAHRDDRPLLLVTPEADGALAICTEPGAYVSVDGRPLALSAAGRSTWPAPAGDTPVVVTARKDGRSHSVRRWRPWPAERFPEPPWVGCPRVAAAPVIDGRIGPEEWPATASVRTPLLANGAGVAEATTLCYFAHEAERLYFAARCVLPPGFGAEEQSVSLVLDPAPLGDAKLELVMAGVGKRYATLKSRRGHTTPRLGWRWAQRATADAWECEMSLEFGDVVPVPSPGDMWGLNCERQCGSEAGTWALTFGDIRRLGRLQFTTW